MITIEQLKAFATGLSADACAELLEAINETLEQHSIDNLKRIRFFLSQAYYETEGFTRFSEDLFYSTPQRLVTVWPNRFTLDETVKGKAYAPDYTANPEKLSNLVYANRNGNGDESSGDGFKYRGRGGFHLTFKDNYRECSEALYDDLRLVDNPDLVMAYPAGLSSAGWFWDKHNMNSLADADEFTKVTVVVNGSDSSVPARLTVLNKANKIFM